MSKEAMNLRTAAEKVVELCSERPLSLGKWFIDMSEACESLREALAEQPAQQALNKMAQNARDIGLDYEPSAGTQVSKVWRDGGKLVAKQVPLEDFYKPAQQEPVNKYCCHLCFNKSGQVFLDRMILCPECGNKRCPKATHHDLPCTKSNDLGQKGSIYDQPAQRTWVGLSDEEADKIYNDGSTFGEMMRMVEAKLRSKNEDRH